MEEDQILVTSLLKFAGDATLQLPNFADDGYSTKATNLLKVLDR